MNNIFVIGVGLIGGSLCLDIKKIYPKVKVYGIDTSNENLDMAIKLNLIDYKSSLDVLDDVNHHIGICSIHIRATYVVINNFSMCITVQFINIDENLC